MSEHTTVEIVQESTGVDLIVSEVTVIDTVPVGPMGPPGPEGPQGPQGEPGEAGVPDAHGSTHENGGVDELALDASQITTGTLDDARIPATVARDTEVTSAIDALATVYQPIDSDLTAIAALTTTSFGRNLLALADAPAGRTALGLGTAATSDTGDFDPAGSAAAAQAASQPLDSDLTAIAALTTTLYGRAFLALTDAAAGRAALGLGTAATSAATAFDPAGSAAGAQAASQPLDADLTAIAALTTTAFGRALLALADATALRSTAGLVIGTDVQAHSAVLDATTASFTTADETKLDGIETGADVTDSTNVAAAGAVMESDTSTVSMSFVVDEDNMVSDSDTKVPTQQSVKAYVDAQVIGGGGGTVDTVAAGTGIDVDATDPANPVVSIESGVYRSGGTDVAVVDGGTGASDAATARSNLGLAIGSQVQAYDADLDALAAAGNSAVLAATTASFLTADETKLDGIEAGADVTDAANVAAAGAAMLASGGTFAADVSVPDEAYGVGWNGSVEVPTKNALYDKIETLQPLDADLTTIAGLADPNADRILFWDDSAGAYAYLQASTGLTITTTSMTVRAASATQTGIVELATDAETTTGTDTSRAITPANLTSQIGTRIQAHDADLTTLAAAGNSAVLAATTASFLTADETKLDGIEAGADVTDATNVAAAGAVMESDTSTASMSFVVDEDDMVSNSATKVPTQQSVKAYVDAVPEEVLIEDPDNPGTYIQGPVYIGVTDPAIGGADPYVWLDPSALTSLDAADISYAGGTGMSATDVEAAIDELATEKANDADLTAHITDTTDAHDASAISYAGGTGMSATDVEAAIDELATEKANLASPTFTGDVVVPDANAATEAMNRQTSDARYPQSAQARHIVVLTQAAYDALGTPDANTLYFING